MTIWRRALGSGQVLEFIRQRLLFDFTPRIGVTL